MVNIILDTNFLLIPAQFGVDIFAEIGRLCDAHTLWIIDRSVQELQAIAHQKGKDGQAAKVALELISKKQIRQLPANDSSVDDAIVAQVREGWIVGTQDRELRKQLTNNRLLTMRGKSHLTIE